MILIANSKITFILSPTTLNYEDYQQTILLLLTWKSFFINLRFIILIQFFLKILFLRLKCHAIFRASRMHYECVCCTHETKNPL